MSAETPALFLAFGILSRGKQDLAGLPLTKRRPQLEEFAERGFIDGGLFRLTPTTADPELAVRWLALSGGSSDGVIAKRIDLAYQGGTREGMQKINRHRSADCVIGGFRYGEKPIAGQKVAGSVLLGLNDSGGMLHHVGFSSGTKAALTDRLEVAIAPRSFTGNTPDGQMRWASTQSSEWQPVKPKFVVEVSSDRRQVSSWHVNLTVALGQERLAKDDGIDGAEIDLAIFAAGR